MLNAMKNLSHMYNVEENRHIWGHEMGIEVFIWPILWIVFSVILITFIINWSQRFKNGSTRAAQDILKARYAKGEITKIEYDKTMKDLKG